MRRAISVNPKSRYLAICSIHSWGLPTMNVSSIRVSRSPVTFLINSGSFPCRPVTRVLLVLAFKSLAGLVQGLVPTSGAEELSSDDHLLGDLMAVLRQSFMVQIYLPPDHFIGLSRTDEQNVAFASHPSDCWVAHACQPNGWERPCIRLSRGVGATHIVVSSMVSDLVFGP